MFETIQEFRLKAKVRKLEQEIKNNTAKRRQMLIQHKLVVERMERFKRELKELLEN